MSNQRAHTPLLVALCSAAFLFSACDSSSRTPSGSNIPKGRDASVAVDAGSEEQDAGSQGACSANPNGCAANELLGGPPACHCLGICASGFVYNAATRTCDVSGGGNDGGTTNPRDGGQQGGNDGGPVEPGACTGNGDCTGAGETCISTSTGEACAGHGDCACFVACVPFRPANQSTCSPGDDCTWLGASNSEGLCLQSDNGSTTNGGNCTVLQWGANDFPAVSTCSRTRNFFCFGATPQQPSTGECVALCNPQNDTLCRSLGNFDCDPLQSDPTLGFCVSPRPSHTDYARDCTSGAQCQSGFCAQSLGNLCSARCGVITDCAPGGLCVGTQQEGYICALECTPGTQGDNFCRAANPNTTCYDLSSPGQPPLGVCVPQG